MKRTRLLLSFFAATALTAMTAQAGFEITGEIWENADATLGGGFDGSFANVATMSARQADVTFTRPSGMVDWDSRRDIHYTIEEFIGGVTYTFGESEKTKTLDNTLFYLTGSITVKNGQTLSVTHDDGLQMMIGTTMVFNSPTKTSPITDTHLWTGASGTYNFELAYAENSGPPGVLQLDLTAVPEPTTVVGGALVLLPLVTSFLRRFKKG